MTFLLIPYESCAKDDYLTELKGWLRQHCRGAWRLRGLLATFEISDEHVGDPYPAQVLLAPPGSCVNWTMETNVIISAWREQHRIAFHLGTFEGLLLEFADPVDAVFCKLRWV